MISITVSFFSLSPSPPNSLCSSVPLSLYWSVAPSQSLLVSPALFSSLSFILRACEGTATRCNSLQLAAIHSNTLQHTATHCNTLQHSATLCNTLQNTAPHGITLQHTATHVYAGTHISVCGCVRICRYIHVLLDIHIRTWAQVQSGMYGCE